MERLTRYAYVLAALLAGTGAYALAQSNQSGGPKVTEKIMEERAPLDVPGYQLIPGPEGLAYTYKMDKRTYETLKPFGIVARNYTDGAKTYDAVLISSDSHESFHDPKICFSGQGYSFTHANEQVLDLPDGRSIPMTVVEMNGRKPTDSTFYRFMPSTPGVTLEQLKGFIKTYMVAAAQQSGGFF